MNFFGNNMDNLTAGSQWYAASLQNQTLFHGNSNTAGGNFNPQNNGGMEMMLPAGFVPGNRDVICGKSAQQHSGNAWCRTLVEAELEQFWSNAKEARKKDKKKNTAFISFPREEKTQMIHRIIHKIQRMSPLTGGFVRAVPGSSGFWVKVPVLQAQKKIVDIMQEVVSMWDRKAAIKRSQHQCPKHNGGCASSSAADIPHFNFLQQYVTKQTATLAAEESNQDTDQKKRARDETTDEASRNVRQRPNHHHSGSLTEAAVLSHRGALQAQATARAVIIPSHTSATNGASPSTPSGAAITSCSRESHIVGICPRLLKLLEILEKTIPDNVVEIDTNPLEPNPISASLRC